MFKILVIVDDKLSSLNQCDSLISELKRSKKKILVNYMNVGGSFSRLLPSIILYGFLYLKFLFSRSKYKLKVNFIISCGRISAPYNLFFKKINNCKNCHILNPYILKKGFNKIIIPEYDLKKFTNKENVITTNGSLVNLNNLKSNRNNLNKIKELIDNKLKIVLVLIGGVGKSSMLTYNDLEKTFINLKKTQIKKQLIFCFSRRTPQKIKDKIIKKKSENTLIFPDNNFNPYWELLHISDFIFVTSDSISMTSDSLSTGKPTYIIPVRKVKNKINFFQKSLIKKNITRVFSDKLEYWSYSKFNESKKVGKILRNYLKL
tara:strand:+ start:220 stop:1173 length:954 start_codon:yes stop_codon:yes gene_type:complete